MPKDLQDYCRGFDAFESFGYFLVNDWPGVRAEAQVVVTDSVTGAIFGTPTTPKALADGIRAAYKDYCGEV